MSAIETLRPDWPAPANVLAATTLRAGGVSRAPYDTLNLAMHVGDDPAAVAENRRRASAALQLPTEPCWLTQVHGTCVHVIGRDDARSSPAADASVTFEPGRVCVVMTADCLPVLFCDRAGTRVGAAHAGWKGLVGGVLQATIAALDVPPDELIAWLGPAIEPEAFEVGEDVLARFVGRNAAHAESFLPNANGRWQADLYALATRELECSGVTRVHGGGLRCYADAQRFFSYRRDLTTGRMATMIWLTR